MVASTSTNAARLPRITPPVRIDDTLPVFSLPRADESVFVRAGGAANCGSRPLGSDAVRCDDPDLENSQPLTAETPPPARAGRRWDRRVGASAFRLVHDAIAQTTGLACEEDAGQSLEPSFEDGAEEFWTRPALATASRQRRSDASGRHSAASRRGIPWTGRDASCIVEIFHVLEIDGPPGSDADAPAGFIAMPDMKCRPEMMTSDQ
jgi:hypothetical protein